MTAESMATDSTAYRRRKRFFDNMLTVYGRKPVLEALLQDLPCHRLHLADSNRNEGIISEILQVAKSRGIEIAYHSRQALSRISKNSKQDQGVAADIACPNHLHLDDFIARSDKQVFSLIAVDGVTNPQNLGMIIRTVTASPCAGLILPQQGNAAISPLVIKASAGSIFKSTLLRCPTLVDGLTLLQQAGTTICVLDGAGTTLPEAIPSGKRIVYVLGNETNGVSHAVRAMADLAVRIPMANGVESLNVAVTAALLAFRQVL